MKRRTTLLAVSLLLAAHATALVPAADAQSRRSQGPPELRVKPHSVQYLGILEVVGEIGDREQYRIGPDTIYLGVDVTGEGDDMTLRYSLQLGDADPSTGDIELSELGFEVAQHWRPALEMLPLLSIVPFTQTPRAEGGSWNEITGYPIPELDLEFAEATRFNIESIDGDRVKISFSTEGGGSTTIDRPQLGSGATMEVNRQSAREGSFVFSIERGYVTEAERLEKMTNTSVVYANDEATVGPIEVQTVRMRLIPAGGD